MIWKNTLWIKTFIAFLKVCLPIFLNYLYIIMLQDFAVPVAVMKIRLRGKIQSRCENITSYEPMDHLRFLVETTHSEKLLITYKCLENFTKKSYCKKNFPKHFIQHTIIYEQNFTTSNFIFTNFNDFHNVIYNFTYLLFDHRGEFSFPIGVKFSSFKSGKSSISSINFTTESALCSISKAANFF